MMKRDFIKDNFDNQVRWVGHANNAASIILGLAGLSFFWMATKVAEITDFSSLTAFLLATYLLTAGGAIVCLLLAVMPRIDGTGESLVFFGDIAKHQKKDYVQEIGKCDDARTDALLVEQTHIIAGIAVKKFRYIRSGILLLLLSVVPAPALIYLI